MKEHSLSRACRRRIGACRAAAAFFSLGLAVGGCVNTIGQVEMIPADRNGDLTSGSGDEGQIFISKGDTFSIRLDSLFLRNLQEAGDGEVIVYAEVFDRQPDDREQLVHVLFKELDQASGFLVNQRDRLVYGPVTFHGHPIRVRLFVVELDKDENETVRNLVRTAVQIGATANPSFAPYAGPVTAVGDLLLALNEDDRELTYDFTLYPQSSSAGYFLRTGNYVLIKTEHRRRAFVGTWFDGADPGLPSAPDGVPIQQEFEDYTTLFTYEKDDGPDHPLMTKKGVTPLNVLRVRSGQLWLETVALERDGSVVLADARFCKDGQPLPACDPAGAPSERRYVVGGQTVRELVVDGESFRIGERFQYQEKTHAVFTVTTGGVPAERGVLQAMSAQDRTLVEQALRAPLTPADLQEKLRALQTQAVKVISRERAIETANANVTKEQRRSGAFVVAYLAQLSPATDDLSRPKNEAILEIVQSLVTNLPSVDVGNAGSIATARGYTADHFCPEAGGRFTFKAAAATPCPVSAAPST